MAAGWRTRHNTCNRTIKGISIYWPVCAVVVCVLRPLLYIYNENQQQQPVLLAQLSTSSVSLVVVVVCCLSFDAGLVLFYTKVELMDTHPPHHPPFFIYSLPSYILDVCLLLYVPSISFHSSLSFLSLFPYPVTGSTPFLFFLLQCAFLSFLFLELDSLYRLTMLLLLLRLLCMLAPLSHFIINGGNIREPTPRSLPGTSSPPLYTQYIIQRVPQPKKWGVEETGLHKK